MTRKAYEVRVDLGLTFFVAFLGLLCCEDDWSDAAYCHNVALACLEPL